MNTIVNTIIVSTNSCQPHRQEELTESELCNVSGGGSKTGAGKVTFNPFSITKHIDVASPKLFRSSGSAAGIGPIAFARFIPRERPSVEL